MFLILFTQFIFGFYFFIRKQDEKFNKVSFQEGKLTKIGTLYLLYLVFITLLFKKSPLFLILLIHLPTFLVLFFDFLKKQWRKKQFRKEFHTFLSQIVLQMRLGHSFRQSILVSNEQNSGDFKTKVQKIYNIVCFSPQDNYFNPDSFVSEVVNEFIKIDKSPHLALKVLLNLKNKLLIESDFRRRSGKILYQVQIQSMVIGVLYFALMFFVINQYGWGDNKRVILSSMCLFLIGLVTLIKLGRSFKWNI